MRKLAIGSISFAFAVLFASLANNIWVDFAFFTLFAALFILFCLLLRENRLKWCSIAAGFIAFGFLWTGCYSLFTTEKAHELSGSEVYITAEITDYPVQYDSYARSYVRIRSGAPELKAILYENESDSKLAKLSPGDIISLTVSLKSADERHGEAYDRYKSLGIYFTASAKSEITKVGESSRIKYIPVIIKNFVSSRIEELFDSNVYPFFQSLLLGDKSNFYNDVSMSVAMSRAGIMHVVAVSGMHISFLVGFITLISGNNKKSSFICIVIIWLFVLVTGSSPSAVRAGFMQTLLLMAPFFNREDDAVTSLAFALFVILLFNPFAIFSVSLQLSFAAMAGIILFALKLNAYFISLSSRISDSKIALYLISILSSSLSVMVFTVPITAMQFGSVQLLSIVTNIFVLWAVSLAFCGGYIAVFVSLINFKAGSITAMLAALPAKHIIASAKLISGIPYSTIYISKPEGNFVIIWLVLVYIFAILAVLYKSGRVSRVALPLICSVVSIALVLYSNDYVNRSGDGKISVLDVGQGECICAFSGDKTVVIDCGSSLTLENAGEVAGEYLLSCGRTKIDAVILTHLHNDHVNGIPTLLEYVKADKIFIAADAPDDDGTLDSIISAADKAGTEIVFLEENTVLKFNDIFTSALYMPDDADSDSANEMCLYSIVDINGYKMLVTGDSEKAQELSFIEKYPVNDIDLLVAGHHGSKYSSDEKFISSIGCSTAVISTGYNTYGHPTYETLNRFNNYGYKVYRTDLNGTVSFSVG